MQLLPQKPHAVLPYRDLTGFAGEYNLRSNRLFVVKKKVLIYFIFGKAKKYIGKIITPQDPFYSRSELLVFHSLNQKTQFSTTADVCKSLFSAM